ncbi:MAG: hypothetical protein PVF45_06570 [Anaerolineae bacterium]|jgi:hypothetical protein
MNNILKHITKAIDEADEEAAAQRVAELRQTHPDATTAELIERLIKRKAVRTGAVGAVTSGAAVIPGLGTLTSLTFGVAADIGVTFKLQAELVLEIAAVYERQLSAVEKRNAVLLVSGIGAGANQLLSQTGARIAQRTSERLAQKAVTKAIPVLGAAASAGTNILSTYVVGQRARAYFELGPEAVGDWAESVRAISGLDERKLVAWLGESAERSWALVQDRAHSAAGATIGVSKSAGNLVVVGASKTGQAVAGAGKSLARGASAVAGASADLGQRTRAGISARADRAGEAARGAGRSAVETVGGARQGLAKRARDTAGTVREAGRKRRAVVVERAKSVRGGKKERDASQDVADGAGADKVRFSRVRRIFRRDKVEKAEKKRLSRVRRIFRREKN